jgi:formate hydrogenlyase transcriptional activator
MMSKSNIKASSTKDLENEKKYAYMESLVPRRVLDFNTDSASSLAEKIKMYAMEGKLDPKFSKLLLSSTAAIDRERRLLLALSDELTHVRDKDGMICLFSAISRELLGLGQISLGLITDGSYALFCSSPTCNQPQGTDNGHRTNAQALKNTFYQDALKAECVFKFDLEEATEQVGSPDYLQQYLDWGMNAGVMVPLKRNGKTIGFLEVYAEDESRFSGEFMAVINGISPQVSNVLSNILLNQQLAEKTRINKGLIALSNTLVSLRHEKDLLNVLKQGLSGIFGYSHAAIIQVDHTLGFYSSFASGQEVTDKDISKFRAALNEQNSIADGVCDMALSSFYPVVLDAKMIDLRSSPLWYRFNYSLGIRETLIKMLPNGSAGRFALMLFAEHPDSFDRFALEIIERISDQLSHVVSNLDTNEKLRTRAREKTLLLDFSNDIARVRTKGDLSEAIRKLLKRLAFPVGMYAISKINEDWKSTSCYIHELDVPADFKNEFSVIEKARFVIHDGIQQRILSNSIPLIFNIQEELERENAPDFLRFWHKMGLEHVVGTALRTGNTDLGIFWTGMEGFNPPRLKGICAQISIALANIIANEQLLKYKRSLEIENNDLQQQINTFYNFSEIIGKGSEMQKVYHLVNAVSPSDTTVMISGETGTGKELIARAIHNASPRSGKLMVKVNCAALPAELIESELFGHEKGAFTGAYEQRIGKFELAHEGTLFLDEIGEMPLDLQVKLLRVLQEREFERIGGKETLKVDVRIIAATNRDLSAEVTAGKFRSDLFYRLNVFPIQLPPLRARLEDIEPLTVFFIQRYSKLTGMKVNSASPVVLQKLRGYSWPGNIRELEHLIERSVLLCGDEVLRSIDLPVNPPQIQGDEWNVKHNALHEAERAYILEVLKGCEGKISGEGGAAERLDLPASTLHSKMKKLGINRIHYSTG